MSTTDLETPVDTEKKVKKPKRYFVVFVNDDFTPMEFVMEVLVRIFKLTPDEAEAKTMEIHAKGRGAVGPYPHEIAETRQVQTMQWARKFEFPLACEVEKE